MPVDFDDDDISGVIEETEEVARTPARQFRPVEATPEQDLDNQMSEVEKRLEMAQYYRLVLNDTIFNDPPNVEVADRVESEIREFVRERMALLVGVGEEKKPQVASVFTDAEIQALRTIAQPEVVGALKALAAKVLKKPAILEAKPIAPPTPEKPKVIKEPSLKKIVRPGTPKTETPAKATVSQPAPKPVRGKKQEKVYKTVVDEAGNEVKMDITPQAQPVGVKPFPTPAGKAAIEMNAAQVARQQAMVAVANLDKQFSGK